MAIVCIKIGENEPPTYPKFAGLSKHMDIIEVLPRKRDKNGNLLNRTMGNKGDKHYLGLNVDMSCLDDKEFSQVRSYLREVWQEIDHRDNDDKPVLRKVAKRLRFLDLSKVHYIGLSSTTVDSINEKANLRQAKQPLDMMEINKFHIVIPFESFAKCVINKETGETLEGELALSGKTVKDVISKVKTKEFK